MKKRGLALLLAVSTMFAMVGCGAGEAAAEKQSITIAIGNGYAPFCYLDESEKPAGYEYELFEKVAEKMSDEYEVEIVCDSWDNLFVGLESGKYDVVSHHLAYNAERAEKYTVSGESLMFYGNYRVVHKDGRTDITDLDSLRGMTLANAPTDNIGKILLAYNEENTDNPIILQETYPSTEAIIAGIQNDLYDGYIHTAFDLQTKYLDAYPDAGLALSEVDLVEDLDCGTYALFKKGNTELQEKFDAAVKAVRDDGGIKELCEKWYGKDYSVNPN